MTVPFPVNKLIYLGPSHISYRRMPEVMRHNPVSGLSVVWYPRIFASGLKGSLKTLYGFLSLTIQSDYGGIFRNFKIEKESPIITRVTAPMALTEAMKTNFVQRISEMLSTTSTVAPVFLRT